MRCVECKTAVYWQYDSTFWGDGYWHCSGCDRKTSDSKWAMAGAVEEIPEEEL